eukprot:GEMP01014923.1.p1 GENE.GEMP01014923.1~~GEMP01014923.1.p1  ORF type:complete len:260 (+),score=51.55 GEMP01014923.1:340-1119(+)
MGSSQDRQGCTAFLSRIAQTIGSCVPGKKLATVRYGLRELEVRRGRVRPSATSTKVALTPMVTHRSYPKTPCMAPSSSSDFTAPKATDPPRTAPPAPAALNHAPSLSCHDRPTTKLKAEAARNISSISLRASARNELVDCRAEMRHRAKSASASLTAVLNPAKSGIVPDKVRFSLYEETTSASSLPSLNSENSVSGSSRSERNLSGADTETSLKKDISAGKTTLKSALSASRNSSNKYIAPASTNAHMRDPYLRSRQPK